MNPIIDLNQLPTQFSTPEEAQALVQAYTTGKGRMADRLIKLERQALFMLLIEALDHPDYAFKRVRLNESEPNEEGEESIDIEFFGDETLEEDDDNYHLAFDYKDEVAGKARKFIDRMTPPPGDDEKAQKFFQTLCEGITVSNRWEVASKLFGKTVGAQMQAQYIAARTPDAGPSTPRPRI